MPSSSRQNKNILIVDQSDALRVELTEPLARFGYACRVLAGTAEAITEVGRAPEPDLVILDLSAPSKKDLAFVMTVRAAQRTRDLPILVVIPADQIGRVAEYTQAGCSDFLVRPVDGRLLYQRVQKLIEGNPRNYRRAPCTAVAEVSTGRSAFIGELREIGEGGASVLLSDPLLEGDLVRLVFTLPRQEQPITAGGEVVYNLPSEGKTLCGLKFVILDREGREAIARFVESERQT